MGSYDLIFLDVPGGLKAFLLDGTITALKPGGQLLIDDMRPYWSKRAPHRPPGERDPERLLEDPRVTCALLRYASGMILATRLPA